MMEKSKKIYTPKRSEKLLKGMTFMVLLVISLYSILIYLSSCSNIDENERLIYVPLDYKVPASGVPRHVLIEDFTGQNCPNCPLATQIIEQLHQTYDSAIVAVAIHSGPLGVLTTEHPEGLATLQGNEYYKYWNVEVQPSGVINRAGGVLSYTDWIAKVNYDLKSRPTSPVDIRIATDYDEDTRKITFGIDVVAVKDSTVEGKMQLWLTEDSILAYQDMPTGQMNATYLHNHVLRSVLNGAWGEEVSVADGAMRHFTKSLQADPSWDAKQLAVVAFVYNDAGVVQVARKRLFGKEQKPEEPNDTIPTDSIPNDTIPSDSIPNDTIPVVVDYDTTFEFEDAQGHRIVGGSTITITELEDGQMNTGLYLRNASDDNAAGMMKCDISAMPNGTFSSCAFGQCLAPWTKPGIYDSYKNVLQANQPAQPILTEWVPDAYGEWECTFQLCKLNIVTQNLFGVTTEKAGNDIIAYGPKITIRFIYKAP